MQLCDQLLEQVQVEMRAQVALAVDAEVIPIIEMHIDLATLLHEQMSYAEILCKEEDR